MKIQTPESDAYGRCVYVCACACTCLQHLNATHMAMWWKKDFSCGNQQHINCHAGTNQWHTNQQICINILKTTHKLNYMTILH